MQKLSEKFVNYEVCHPTGIEIDIIEACHNFLLENLPDYENTWVYETCNDHLSGETDNIDYFTFEELPDYMQSIAPVNTSYGTDSGGCYGFWQVIDFDEEISAYTQKLRNNKRGYTIFHTIYNTTNLITGQVLASQINAIDSFLTAYFDDAYYGSNLETTINDYDWSNSDNLPFGYMIKNWFIQKLVPVIAPDTFTWQESNKGYGIYPPSPTYKIVKNSKEEKDTIASIGVSSIFELLMFVKENRMSHDIAYKDLTSVCYDIVKNWHYRPFYEIKEDYKQIYENNYDKMLSYIMTDDNLANWIIDNIYEDDFKKHIYSLIHNDITSLFIAIDQSGIIVDGIDFGDIYSKRETCPICEDLPTTSEDCPCSTYDELTNVWIISDKEFYNSLGNVGAMVYETDSLYLYFQTTYSGNAQDIKIRLAWLDYCHMAFFHKLCKPWM